MSQQFEITAPDGRRFVVTAPPDATQDQVLAYVQQQTGGGAPAAPEPPKPQRQGSFLGNAVDSLTQGAAFGFGDEITAAEAALLGRTPEGGWFDYSMPMGERYDRALEAERGQNKAFSASDPVASTALEMTGALAGAVATPIGLVGAPKAGASMLRNGLRAGAGGAALGGAYGFGTGEGGFDERVGNMALPAAAGGALGAAAVPAMSGVQGAVRRFLDRPAADAAGVSVPAMRIARETVAGDAAMGGGAARIAQAGPDAMLADSGPGATSLLDAVGQYPGGRQIVQPAVQQRAAQANQTVNRVLDETMGPPQGVNATARDISKATATRRQDTYDAAYSKPIDYASDLGREIEGVLSRIPPATFRRAVQEANDDMVSRGVKNQQIMAEIADDGTVTFREMPNVQQLDEIKKALQAIGRQEVDTFGRPTGAGARAKRLAGEMRDALGRAVPEYNAATQAGADKIAMDQALELGTTLLRPQTTREAVADAVRGMSEAERRMVLTGVRAQVDEAMANVQRAVADGNMDAREASRALRELSSRAARTKLGEVLGREAAERMFDDLEQAVAAIELRANVAQNSRTAPRQLFNETLDAEQQTLRNTVLSGNVPSIMARGVQTVTGRTPADMARMKEGTAAELARLLTEPRGRQAEILARVLANHDRNLPAVQAPTNELVRILLMGSRPSAAAGADANR